MSASLNLPKITSGIYDLLRRQHFLGLANILAIGVLFEEVLSYLLSSFHSGTLQPDLLLWRTGQTGDHVLVIVAMLVLFLFSLRKLGFTLGNISTSSAPLQSLGYVFMTYGIAQIIWGYVAYFADSNPARHTTFQILSVSPDWLPLILGFILSGISIRKLLKLVVVAMPPYLGWILIGFPITLDTTTTGTIIKTAYYSNPWVSALEIGVWVWVIVWVYVFEERC